MSTITEEHDELLSDLRSALKEWFDERPGVLRPTAIVFRCTTDYVDGTAWDTGHATVYVPGLPEGADYRDDFQWTEVGDALNELSEFNRPQSGDRLRVLIPAV